VVVVGELDYFGSDADVDDDIFRGVGMLVVLFPNDRIVRLICITKIICGLVGR